MSTTDPILVEQRVPTRAECVLSEILAQRAEAHPDRTFASFTDGTTWTYGALLPLANATGRALRELGVEQDDRVLCWLPNGQDLMRVWFGSNVIGGICAVLNTSYRGALLERVIATSRARVLVVHADLLQFLAGIDLADVHTIVASDGYDTSLIDQLSVRVVPMSATISDDSTPIEPERQLEPWDTQMILYTSGTTGPSKGVLVSYAHSYMSATSGRTNLIWGGAPPRADDCFLINFPLYHIIGTVPMVAMLLAGASVAVEKAFSTDTFWSRVKATGATLAWFTGVMVAFLLAEPPTPEDTENALRLVMIGPVNEDAHAFGRRFAVDFNVIYNQTENCFPIISDLNPPVGAAGRLRPGAEVRIVDEHDRELADGQVGELIVRFDTPWSMTSGYDGMPEATARAWRNGWWHTGDALYRDSTGHYYFVDRLDDCIRRRGENISSFEVEEVAGAHPAVAEVAAVAARSKIAEDEVLVAVVLYPGQEFDHAEFIEFCRERMAYYMVPRYVRIVDELPKTQTNKVRKSEIRAAGVTPETWDRSAAGIRIKRTQLH